MGLKLETSKSNLNNIRELDVADWAPIDRNVIIFYTRPTVEQQQKADSNEPINRAQHSSSNVMRLSRRN